MNRGVLLAGMTALALAGLLPGCAKQKAAPAAPPPLEKGFVGAQVCAGCHPDVSAEFQGTGHAHALTAVAGGQKPGSPLFLPDTPPAGYGWKDISYVIGGFGWRALFVNQGGQLVSVDQAQYNLANEQFPSASTSPYNVSGESFVSSCGRCHAVGADPASNSIALPGAQCEACHGPASIHVANRDTTQITVDNSAEACGRCHSQSLSQTLVSVAVSTAGADTLRFLRNNQQYTELQNSPHAGLKCTDCHDPHLGVRQGQVGGIVRTCTACHHQVALNHPSNSPTCIDCHMPRVASSARTANKYTADVRSHLFRIHVGPESLTAGMYQTAGDSTVARSGYGLGLGYVCYTCHKDASGTGGSDATLTESQIRTLAPHIHGF